MTNYSAPLQTLFDGLNEHQTRAINVGQEQACLIGVPGSGKTRTIVARIARMVADGLDPQYILAMTFTRAAAQEMTDRLKSLGIHTARVGTIHSVCRQIIASDTAMFQDYRLDERNQLHLELKKTLGGMRKDRKIPNTGVDLEGVSRYVEACKARGLCYVYTDPFGLNMRSEEVMLRQADNYRHLAGLPRHKLLDVFIAFEQRRGSLGLYGFDDMLLWAWMQLAVDPMSRERWRGRWSVVIVDEAQDSNPVQWDISRFLVGLDSCIPATSALDEPPVIDDRPHSLMVGGDPSQSIFGWRSAEPTLFVEYSKHKDVTTYVLPVNYRSNSQICDVGTHIVKGRPWHLAGKIQPAVPEAAPKAVKIARYDTSQAEADDVIAQCMAIAQDSGLRSCAVLSRLRVGLDLAEIACIRNRIPYIKMASGSFFESREVKDILAYLRVAAGYDEEGRWLRHIINRPFRYIGNAFIGMCESFATANGISLLDAMMLKMNKLNYRQRNSLEDLYKLLQELNEIAVLAGEREQAHQEHLAACAEAEAAGKTPPVEPKSDDIDRMLAGPAQMIGVTLRRTDYLEELRREEGLLGLDESKQAMLTALQRMAVLFRSVREFLIYVDRLTVAVQQAKKSGLRKKESDKSDALVLSTIHRCKGLEWGNVFLVDVVQGRFPCARAEDADEELRLLYVAVTRAIKTCNISYVGPPDPDKSAKPKPKPRRNTYEKSSETDFLDGESDVYIKSAFIDLIGKKIKGR